MQSRTSVGDGSRVSASSTPSNTSGGSDPDDIESLGDIYIWGEVLSDGISPDGMGIQVPCKTDVLIPKPLESNVVLDAHHIVSGAHHIGIVTRKGELFTWGEESGGRLGLGIDKDFRHPHLVEFLAVTDLDIVACGEYHTCAVSKYDDLFTWGDGTHNAGLLGHGTEASHWIPKRIDGALDGLQVVSVSCGTWHSAFATSNGKLFTFGEGTFGVLGHGDQESVWYPKEVQLLSGLKTIKVACGVWHTAAIIEVLFQSASNGSSWKLFTWGDGDKYRLGHGNKETYLQPTRVSPLIEYNFHQIACGHTLTVALTTSGHVFTMGGTENGQLGNPNSAGKVPTLVQAKLLGEFVEEISCGAHHVAVLTSRKELYTWGKGAKGRLGHGDTEDRKSPTVVEALKDRHIKNISCGSNFTSCICIHKWVSGTDQSVCSGCRQAFGLTRKRHNCYNCGLVFCHTCSSKKALKAAMAPTPEKPHRVCDTCHAKLKVVEAGDASKFTGKDTPSHINSREKLGQGVVRSARILLSPPITEPVKYLEIKSSKPGTKYGSTSFVRASQVPSLLQLKDIVFPSSLSSIQSIFKPSTPLSPSQNPPQSPPADSSPKSPYPSRSSPPHSAGPRFSGSLINSLRRTSDLLNKEVSKLQDQIQSLKERSDMKDVVIQKLQRKATEATALAAVESSNLREAKEFIESTTDQMKEVTEKLPLEIPETKILLTLQTQAEEFVKEISESETSSSLSKLESKQQNALHIPAAGSGFSKLQENRLEENVDAGVDTCRDGGNILDEINGSKLESVQQNAPDTPTLDSGTFELQQHRLQENADAVGVEPCQDGRTILEEINGSKLESVQQNATDIPTLDSDTSELQEHRLEENADAVGVDPCRDGRNIVEINGSMLESEQQNAPDISTLECVTSELQHRPQENVDAVGGDPYQDRRNSLEQVNGSKLESEQQNAPDISTLECVTSELQHRLQENVDAVGVDTYQDRRNSLEQVNGSKLESEQQDAPDIPTSESDTSELQENRLEEVANAAGFDQSEARGHVLQESQGSSISSAGDAESPQNSEDGSRSLDSSGPGRPQETQIIEKFESGVYVILMLRSDGIKIFKRVKFSKRRFTQNQAEEWWNQNKGRVLRKYCPTHQKLTIGSPNITPHANENIEASPSLT